MANFDITYIGYLYTYLNFEITFIIKFDPLSYLLSYYPSIISLVLRITHVYFQSKHNCHFNVTLKKLIPLKKKKNSKKRR